MTAALEPTACHADELPTLRLFTLRRLLAKTVPPMVFDQRTRIIDLEDELAGSRASLAVLVDATHVVQGTLSRADLDRVVDHSVCADSVMSRRIVSMLPETDIEAAAISMIIYRTEYVLVVTSTGELLGALSKADIERRRER